MSHYKDPEKMLKRYAVMKIYQSPGATSQYPIPLALADIFNRTGCICGTEFPSSDIEYKINEVEGEEGEYMVIEAKAICPECNAFLKLTKYIQNKELREIKAKWTN